MLWFEASVFKVEKICAVSVESAFLYKVGTYLIVAYFFKYSYSGLFYPCYYQTEQAMHPGAFLESILTFI